jgi:hypothetical protein
VEVRRPVAPVVPSLPILDVPLSAPCRGLFDRLPDVT